MYLTRFRFNTGRSEARRLLGSPHLMHGAVNMSFPVLPPRGGDQPRVLWRVDQDHRATTTLYIVSPARPDLTHLVEQAGWPTTGAEGWSTFAYTDFLDALKEGDTWRFRLTANPVHSIRLPGDSRDAPTKRTAHRTPRHQKRWLLERQEKAGFEVVRKPDEQQLTERGDEYELVVRDQLPLQFRRPPAQPGRDDVRFTRVTFDGRLRITDRATFRRVLTQGLGKAKAYGCGLLTLAPVARR
ncbi:type I-E CRISPR-associated protein Cas6/Cse3/CasE [Streptomyces sp. XM4011]|uniref:type I-E CRISPR-associated protein Cas6/Cse3/CasE n=1 Tax=Streptomyces sp. XM4011 TaxID=2929780 RepID=UPI001FFACCDB|nr:type I-E CRISPR-associated protein Cas6/Cse3/CasE [Streptomyces sp. XM4011]MCK1816235.1 type I-E CRISPR-associated protein Cas6/Cse3/CasE [Streptomyces sp. XM4011]